MVDVVLHVITGLDNGGAEATLYRLAISQKCRPVVVSLTGGGKYGEMLKSAGVVVYYLNMPRGRVTISGLFRLLCILKKHKPAVVQTWMYHANLIGGIISRLAGVRDVHWGMHNAFLDPKTSKKSTVLASKICAMISHFIPKTIVYCAEKSLAIHSKEGYRKDVALVIPNGYDLNAFSPNLDARGSVRNFLGVSKDTFLLGCVARFDPYKDHGNLIKALTFLNSKSVNFLCILVGKGMDDENNEIVKLINDNKIESKVWLLGERDDVCSIMNAMDCHVLSSSSEAFPNVLCEAMACETPCVSTDVGDASVIVKGTGWIVPPKDSLALGKAMLEAWNEWSSDFESWGRRKESSREEIQKKYSLEAMVKGYEALWGIKG
ncbi:glycosyltransferase [Gallaecimonas sp. GXIMD4217]|uniref:glycosyltransferase family 4 protein n=1 Tax=Gallaecimonas sp. GXIMD4217 TaxID=3131927 RepID=UPI00311AC77E